MDAISKGENYRRDVSRVSCFLFEELSYRQQKDPGRIVAQRLPRYASLSRRSFCGYGHVTHAMLNH
jgi:hypothetical protein